MRGAALVACAVVVFAAGCGGGAPRSHAAARLPAALAARWASEADGVAAALQAHDSCGAQQLAQSLVADVDASSNRVPARLRTALLTGTAKLAARISCVPAPVKPSPKPKPPKPPKKHGPGPGHGHGPGGGGGDGG